MCIGKQILSRLRRVLVTSASITESKCYCLAVHTSEKLLKTEEDSKDKLNPLPKEPGKDAIKRSGNLFH